MAFYTLAGRKRHTDALRQFLLQRDVFVSTSIFLLVAHMMTVLHQDEMANTEPFHTVYVMTGLIHC